MAELRQINMQQYDENGDAELKVTIEGQTEMPIWKHDLAFKTVLALLDSIDIKDFREEGKEDLFFKYIHKIRDLLDDIE